MIRKWIVGMLLGCAVSTSVLANVTYTTPMSVSVQAVLSSSDTGMYVGTRNVTFGFYPPASSNSNTALWSETKAVYFSNGWLNTDLGKTNAIPYSVLNTTGLRLGISVGTSNERVYVPFSVVPYAIQSRYAESAQEIDGTGSFFVLDKSNRRLGIGKTNPSVPLEVAGTVSANTVVAGIFRGDGSQITNLSASNINLNRHSMDAYGSSNEKDVLVITENANVGIGVKTGLEKLHVAGISLVSGTFGSGSTLAVSGLGTRSFFYPKKAAFRAGYTGGTEWDDANIGSYSIGFGNTILASGQYSTVTGGYINTASATYSVVAGGQQNQATDTGAAVLGGESNQATGVNTVVLGGNQNIASGQRSAILGGESNRSTKLYSTVLGGSRNESRGVCSVTAGYRAVTDYDGTFVFSDRSDQLNDFASSAPNQFLIRAAGGVGIGTSSPASGLDVNASVIFRKAVTDSEVSVNGNSGGSVSVDFSNSTKQVVSVGSNNVTLSFTAPTAVMGQAATLTLLIDHQGTGTVSWPSSVKWPGGNAPVLTNSSGKVDIIVFHYRNNVYYGMANLNFL